MIAALFSAWAASAITLQNNTPLAFGSVIASTSAGTVTISPAGARTTSGVFGFGGTGFNAAEFTVTIPQGNPNFTIVLSPSTTVRSASGAAMTIDTFQSTPVDTGDVDRHTRTATITVGATLHVNPSQSPGTYSGSFIVTVTNP